MANKLNFEDQYGLTRYVEKLKEEIEKNNLTKEAVADMATKALGFKVVPNNLRTITKMFDIKWPSIRLVRKLPEFPYDSVDFETLTLALEKFSREYGVPMDERFYKLVARINERANNGKGDEPSPPLNVSS